MTVEPPFAFDPFDEGTRRDPHALFARARRDHPVYRHPGLPVLSVFRHADVQGILRDAGTYSNDFPPPPGFTADDLLPSMLGSDPPTHTRLRGLVSQAFTPRRVRALGPRIDVIAKTLLDEALRVPGPVDLVAALASPLPVIVIAEMLGIPPADRAQFKAWSDDLVADLGAAFFHAPGPEQIATQRRVRAEMRSYCDVLAETRRAQPQDDLLSGLVLAELDGSQLSPEELLGMLVLLLVAGNETTTNLIGNAVLTLLRQPDALAALRADLGLVPSAVQEILRYTAPVQMDVRRVRRPVELHGELVPPDHYVLEWIGSANRDERVFPNPDVFDVRRAENPHLAFGFGPHHCLGANLATLETEIALRAMLERTRTFRRVDETPLPLHPSIVFNGVTALPLLLDPA